MQDEINDIAGLVKEDWEYVLGLLENAQFPGTMVTKIADLMNKFKSNIDQFPAKVEPATPVVPVVETAPVNEVVAEPVAEATPEVAPEAPAAEDAPVDPTVAQ
jgi:hypothetical protein